MPDSSWCARLMPNCVFIESSKIQSKILNDKNIIAIFGVIGQNFGPVYVSRLERFTDDVPHTAPQLQYGPENMDYEPVRQKKHPFKCIMWRTRWMHRDECVCFVILQFSSWSISSHSYSRIIIWATSWENLFLPYANNIGADQPAHPSSLISVFVIRS